jgi:hemolysin D
MSKDAHEFKPILAEIDDTPVSPLSRLTYWFVIAVVVAALLWFSLGEIDVVVSARGKVVPEGEVKLIQPLETGVIQRILVKEGMRVKKGQLLVELDPSTTNPDLISTHQSLAYTKLELDRLQSLRMGNSYHPSRQPYGQERDIQTQRALFESSKLNLQSKLSGKQAALKRVDEQLKMVDLSINQCQKLLRMAEERYQRLNKVRDLLTKTDIETSEKDLLVLRGQIEEAEHKRNDLLHSREQIQSELEEISNSFNTFVLDEMSQREKTVNELEAKSKEEFFLHSKMKIISPVDGIVDQLFIHTEGGVITPAERILTIVPEDVPLKVEAVVYNRDIGYLKPGLNATVKLDTFDYQKYGTLPGILKLISSDSRVVEKQPSEPFYQIWIDLSKTKLLVEGKEAPITPGMSVTAEIKVGSRKIIEYFIYPLIKSFQETLSQR